MFFSFSPDPNMVNAYMYQAGGTNGQAAPPPGQGPPNTSPPYSNYQPTPSQGYQVWLETINLVEQSSVLDRIFKDNFLFFSKTWSLRPSRCPPCPRLSLQMVWGTWATSHIVCRIWFQHCQARTLICPPNRATCQASSPYTNRLVFPFVIVQFMPHLTN